MNVEEIDYSKARCFKEDTSCQYNPHMCEAQRLRIVMRGLPGLAEAQQREAENKGNRYDRFRTRNFARRSIRASKEAKLALQRMNPCANCEEISHEEHGRRWREWDIGY